MPLNPRITAISIVLNSLQEANVQILATVEGGLAAVLELVLPEDFEPIQLKNLEPIEGSIVAGITRRDKTLVPHGDDRLEPGDELLVFSTAEAREAVQKRFCPS